MICIFVIVSPSYHLSSDISYLTSSHFYSECFITDRIDGYFISNYNLSQPPPIDQLSAFLLHGIFFQQRLSFAGGSRISVALALVSRTLCSCIILEERQIQEIIIMNRKREDRNNRKSVISVQALVLILIPQRYES